MTNLLLVDYENVTRIDTSRLDHSFKVMIFVGATQKAPNVPQCTDPVKQRLQVSFHRVSGNGRNALDFHVAFHLGRVFETARDTECFVLSRDKGFDPLLTYLNANGLKCKRVAALSEIDPTYGPCPRCANATLINHNDGLWCAICGRFIVNPDPKHTAHLAHSVREHRQESTFTFSCAHCYQTVDMSDGIYDDGGWMCGGCIASYAR